MVFHPRQLNSVSLCSGGGMLDRGVHRALAHIGIGCRTVCYCEREAYAAAVLVARMEDQALDRAPVWSDLDAFPSGDFAGVMAGGIVVAGIPCQGNSLAGKRKLGDDPRNLWPGTRRILRDLGADYFYLENVRGFIIPDKKEKREAPVVRVLGELADDGWDAEWVVFPASGVGANHKRERVFLLAHRQRAQRGPRIADRHDAIGEHTNGADRSQSATRTTPRGDAVAHREDADRGQRETVEQDGTEPRGVARGVAGGRSGEAIPPMGDAGSGGLRGQEALGQSQGARLERDVERTSGGIPSQANVDDAAGARCDTEGQWSSADSSSGQCVPVEGRHDLPLFAPARNDFRQWLGVLRTDPTLVPAIPRGNGGRVQGVAQDPQPEVRGALDGLADRMVGRNDRLRLCGNGVVEWQAAVAFVHLWQRLHGD